MMVSWSPMPSRPAAAANAAADGSICGRSLAWSATPSITQRTRDVSGKIFSRGVALHRRQVIRAIEDNEAGGVEIGGEPVGGHQPFAAWMRRWLNHMRLSQGARLAEDSGGGT